MTSTPFFEIYTYYDPNGAFTNIYWGLKSDFNDPGPYRFWVDWAEAPDGNREVVADNLTDVYYATDPVKRRYAVDNESYYFVRMQTGSGVYESFAQKAYGTWNKRDWLTARDICRKENLAFKTGLGWQGWLLKRKIWGPPCPVCADWDSKDASSHLCPACFGTGKKDGFWPGYPVYCYQVQGGPAKGKTRDENFGMQQTQSLQMRMLAYPQVATGDVFVSNNSGKRYVINKMQVAAEIKEKPLVYIAEFRLEPFTSGIYNAPVQGQDWKPVCPPPVDTSNAVPDPAFPEPPAPEVVVPPVIEEPLPPEPQTITEFLIPAGTRFMMWWEETKWVMGHTIGDPASVLYTARDSSISYGLLPTFLWEDSNGAVVPLMLTPTVEGFIVKMDTDTAVAGNYVLSGSHNGAYVYLQS